jgi:hypothetical protein
MMDPNAALENARNAAREFIRGIDKEHPTEDILDNANTLAEAFQALDQWITRGGFLPSAWDESWQDNPDKPGWWFLNDGQTIKPVLVHAPEVGWGDRFQWKRIRIPAGR